MHPVRPLRRDALRAVIEGPAELAGIAVDEDLVARLVADTDSGEALPLLAYTLAQLADGVGRGGRLSTSRYEQLGGVQGALARQADAALAGSGRERRGREQVIRELLRLVTVDEQGRPTRWRVRRGDLPDAVLTEFDAFVARRLLITDEDNGEVDGRGRPRGVPVRLAPAGPGDRAERRSAAGPPRYRAGRRGMGRALGTHRPAVGTGSTGRHR